MISGFGNRAARLKRKRISPFTLLTTVKIDIPILLETVNSGNANNSSANRYFVARPLFFDAPRVSHKDRDAALEALENKLLWYLKNLRTDNIESFVSWTFSPEVSLVRKEMLLDLPARTEKLFIPLALFESNGKNIGFVPEIEGIRFEYDSPEQLSLRIDEVLRAYFRDYRKKYGEKGLTDLLEPFMKARHFRLVYFDDVFLEPIRSKRKNEQLSSRLESLINQGKSELDNVGVCLDRLYPHRLEKAICRDAIIERLFQTLNRPKRNAVMLLGPPKVGKTAILHSLVAMMRTRIKRPQHDPHRKEFWQLSPGRLISGMSISGEWEARMQSIFAYASHKDQILNFTQLIALLNTGKSRNSTLSMTDMLLPCLRQSKFRVLVEMNDEQLRILSERNRALADQFEIIHVPEPTIEETVLILLGALRELEWQWKCTFDIDLIPFLMEIVNQYESELAMPGKAVQWLGTLAMRYAGEKITRERFMKLFREKSGLRLTFFGTENNPEKNIFSKPDTPDEIENRFKEKLIGQEKAIESMQETIVLADSLLSDPDRPIASLFFLGPTGVGKTECAKQLARYFFGSEERLLRFDANELCTPSAVARLVGSHRGGEGLLSGAIRRQPFSVVLFDEIEKGHPDLFDLLLQVIGEARLSDTQGRIASFSQAIVIFTSNLGTKEAAGRIGFPSGSGDDKRSDNSGSLYMKAIREFFRPEFVNRIDRIIPFASLTPGELLDISERIFLEIVSREGLRRRRARVLVSEGAKRVLAGGNIETKYGARGMRRFLERELTAPLSDFLSRSDVRNPVVIEVTENGSSGLKIEGYEMREATKVPDPLLEIRENPELLDKRKKNDILYAVRKILENIHETIIPLRPEGRLEVRDISSMSPADRLYYRLNDEYLDIRTELETLRDEENEDRNQAALGFHPKKTNNYFSSRCNVNRLWDQLRADADLEAAIDEIFADRRSDNRTERYLRLIEKVSELHEILEANARSEERVALVELSSGEAPRTEPAENTILSDMCEREIMEMEFSREIPGLVRSGNSVRIHFYTGRGIAKLWKKMEGSTMGFREENLGVSALKVIEVPTDEPDVHRLIENSLLDKTEKWPPVTKIARWKDERFETKELSPLCAEIPEEILTVLGQRYS